MLELKARRRPHWTARIIGAVLATALAFGLGEILTCFVARVTAATKLIERVEAKCPNSDRSHLQLGIVIASKIVH